MAKLVKTNKVDLPATFATLEVDESIDIRLADVKESAVRAAASRYCDVNDVLLKVSVNSERLVSIVIRVA